MGNRIALVLTVLLGTACSHSVPNTGDDAGASGTKVPIVDPNPTTPVEPGRGVSCSSSGTGCSCYTGGTGNSTRCSTLTVGDSICCATSGWPSQGSCDCQRFGCESYGNGDSCSCTRGGSGTSLICTGTLCCQAPGRCECETRTDLNAQCPSDAKTVSSCSLNEGSCYAGDTQEQSCSSSK